MRKQLLVLLLSTSVLTSFTQEIQPSGPDPDGECGCTCAYYKEVEVEIPVKVFGITVWTYTEKKLKRFEYQC